ncbi:MAG: hypothetical protein IID03_10495 [Candidatus Dadabacteria bacterium]|nr:hypothetical protein [Candidatus Dadabacteria bacterium]
MENYNSCICGFAIRSFEFVFLYSPLIKKLYTNENPWLKKRAIKGIIISFGNISRTFFITFRSNSNKKKEKRPGRFIE